MNNILDKTDIRILNILQEDGRITIKALAENIAEQGRNPKAEDTAWLLLDQAKIMEGEEISDPAAFARRLTAFMQKGLVA